MAARRTRKDATLPAAAVPTGPAVPLFAYQRTWFSNRSRFKVGMFSRQTGKTFTSTLEIVDDVMEAEAHGRRARWVILSRGERQAKEAMDEGIKRHLAAYCQAFESFGYDWSADWTNGVKYKALEVVLPGGSRITALPANPDTARGFSANVLLDEFGFHQDSRAIWKALFPVITRGYRIIVISTPNGKNNKFYELITTKDPLWYKQTVDIYQAVAQGYPANVDELRRGLADEDGWAQEYELQFLDEATAWLPFDLITAAEHEQAGQPELYQGGPCFVGVDIGRRNDLWTCWVDEQIGDVAWCRELIELRNAPFEQQDAELDRVFASYNVVRCCMDQTGMGEKPVEDAQRRYGSERVEGVLFTGPNKLTLAVQGKQRFQDQRKRIPISDVLRRDLHKLRKVAGPTGAPRFVAERDDAGHADRTWACFLADNAAAGTVIPIEFQALGHLRLAATGDHELGGYHTTDTGWGTLAGGRLDLRGF
jgi:phage FluMu gp28-like protein